ncbi:response regulator [Paenibacillus sp. YN15]|uniref:response regulator transcription factor n=1 Tax=Paenibacillus sp. YN15 TaxID=1742774 RepID=UPI000DCCDD5E|nr:response regulator [Paenibacillus sp. YN15]RAU95337.1 hypothetical protein DQG13_22530 [Paenibacillus sp. YN15]
MYWKMLIVDDEPVICRGLRYTIPWNSMGIEVVEEAYNGVEALEAINRLPADIVLTDIRMPVMDGLELAQRIAECRPDAAVIMMSGFDDFEYARQAMRLGVQDYLLKPVNIDELSAIVSRMAAQLEERRGLFLEHWLLHAVMKSGIPQFPEAGSTRMWPEEAQYRVVCSQLDDFAALEEGLSALDLDEVRSHWKKNIHEGLTGCKLLHVSAFAHKNLLVTLIFTDESWDESRLTELLSQVYSAWDGLATPRFILCPEKNRQDQIREALQEAFSLLDVPFLKDVPVVSYNGWEKRSAISRQAVYWEGRFAGILLHPDSGELELCTEPFFTELSSEKWLLSDVAEQCRYILYGLFHRFETLELKLEEELHFLGQLDLRVHNSYERLQELFRQDLRTLAEAIRPVSYSRNRSMIDRAEAYIREHMSENLKATDAADHIHVTPGYFSLMFRQETGKNFNEYLNGLRIGKAKELLIESEDKVFEIAEAVGYNDYKHFVFIFKKITGITPTAYRDVHRDRRSNPNQEDK